MHVFETVGWGGEVELGVVGAGEVDDWRWDLLAVVGVRWQCTNVPKFSSGSDWNFIASAYRAR